MCFSYILNLHGNDFIIFLNSIGLISPLLEIVLLYSNDTCNREEYILLNAYVIFYLIFII